MAEDHGAPEVGQLPKAWTSSRKEMSRQKRVIQRIRSWSVQNEMRSVLGRVTAGAA